jgi:endonuclease YncB( thermonuclease family)
MATLAFLLLIAALLLFVLSTRQWGLWVRGAVWVGGVALLVFAALLLGGTARDPELGTALGDFFGKLTHPGDSMLVRMLDSNGATVARILLSLFDIFLFFAAVVSILALIAFRPGEKLEQAIRPLMFGIIGSIIGGLVSLAIVGTGFGTREAERQAYAGPVRSETVSSGDTLLLNGDLVRLRGIDAPEEGQICRMGARVQDCGGESQRALRRILEGAYVICAVDSQVAGGRTVTCTAVKPGGEEFSIAKRMVEEGYAIGVQGSFEAERAEASARARGLTTWCTVDPTTWARFTTAQKNAFRDAGTLPANTATVGVCPRQRPVRGGGNNFPPARSAPQ